MQNLNRDLLVITKKNSVDRKELEETIVSLNKVLFNAEKISVICNATEVFDLNTYKVYRKSNKVAFYLNKENSKPFIFICNKN